MRIIAGIARGMPLTAPKSGGTRPTSDRVREAIFSSLGDRLIGAAVLDLFAGTGALGLEAASRGAGSVLFVEQSKPALRSLDQNIESFRRGREIACHLTVVRADVPAQIRKLVAAASRFSLLFADPPYGEAAQDLLHTRELPRLLEPAGILVLESAARDELRLDPPWVAVRVADYGDTRVTMLVSKDG